ncbi:hypothetical protein KY333_00555 [Candidatus Woesearchaeota archaeon]|nr:hypothetical protein [Candidatus Woesearchaeota archaeon]
MTVGSKRMILYGFYNDSFKKAYPNFDKSTDAEKNKLLSTMSDKDAEGFADHEIFELEKYQMVPQTYPTPKNRYYVVYESPHESIEPIYFFCYNLLTAGGYPKVYKITDIFTASEHSSFWGAATARLGLASDKVSQYMATIGQFIRKDLFQLVRDIRWIDERIEFHEDSRKGIESAEITLKGIWCDMVDGVVQGQRVGANIFQLATQLQFTSLPNWFFALHPQKVEDIDDMINDPKKVDSTRVVKDLLRRKLNQYLVWREANFKELKQRRNFELKYLRQNYNVIKMYLTWLKPYLRHIERLGTDVTKLSSAELIAAFESSMIEIEILAVKIPEGNSQYFDCLLETFEYRTKPSMSFTQETPGYHRGPMHMGEAKISWRAYAWTQEQIDNFIKMKDKEDVELLKTIDSSIKATLDAIGEDLEKYLEQAGETAEAKDIKAPEPKRASAFEPFQAVGKGFGDMFSSFVPITWKHKEKKKKPTKQDIAKLAAEAKKAAGSAVASSYANYKYFKKAHKMLTW